MKEKLKKQIILIMSRLISHFPTRMPVGKTQYDTWLQSVIELAGPIADEQSMAWVISNEIMRLKPGQDRVPKNAFVKDLRRFACMQIAANKVLEIKEAQAQKSKQAEDAANNGGSDVKV